MAGPLARLDVLERHVVELLTFRVRMLDVGEHLDAARLDIQLFRRDSERGHQRVGVAQGPLARGESGKRIAQHVRSGQSQPVHRPAGD